MNSLEFIKQHVTEWPSDQYSQVSLDRDGEIRFHGEFTPVAKNPGEFTSEHYDGKVWTREEFEACGVVETSTGIDATVEERGKNYGAFKDGADIMQQLKSVMRSTPNWSKLTPSQREALEMIQHKVGRILNGDPNYTDNWHDIKGYAHLIEEELNGNVK